MLLCSSLKIIAVLSYLSIHFLYEDTLNFLMSPMTADDIVKTMNMIKVNFKGVPQKEITTSRIFYGLKILHNYKNKFWKKKSWN